MNLVDWFFCVLIGVHLALSCWQLIRLLSSCKWLLREKHFASKATPMNRIHILIPVYMEDGVIKVSVEYFEKLAQYPNVLLYYITTEKEGEKSATAAALKLLSERYTFCHFHYPQTDGFKAHQLNWAIEQ